MTAPAKIVEIDLARNESRDGRQRYPNQPAIDRAIKAFQDAGLEVGGIEITPTGEIRVLDRAACSPSVSEDDKWV